MNERPFGHTGVPADRRPVKQGGVYHGGILLASGDGAATVAIYDGLDNSGELIDYFYAAKSQPNGHVFETGVDVREGVYVDVGSNVSAFTLYYKPPAGEER